MNRFLFFGWIFIIVLTLVGAFILAYYEKKGWGWFIFLAALFGGGFSWNNTYDDKS